MNHQSCLVVSGILLVAALSCEAAAVLPKQFYQCLKSSDCGQGECCVIGMMRYSPPMCLPMLQTGESCRVGPNAHNMTAYYPNGMSLELTDIHTLMCPCDAQLGLACIRGECQTIADQHDDSFTNDIDQSF